MIGYLTQVDEHARHARQHLAVFNHGIEVARIGEGFRQMIANLGYAGLDSEGCVPSAPIRRVEAVRLARLGVGKRLMTPDKIDTARKLLAAGDKPAWVAKLLGVGLSTFYRHFPASDRPEPAGGEA